VTGATIFEVCYNLKLQLQLDVVFLDDIKANICATISQFAPTKTTSRHDM